MLCPVFFAIKFPHTSEEKYNNHAFNWVAGVGGGGNLVAGREIERERERSSVCVCVCGVCVCVCGVWCVFVCQ